MKMSDARQRMPFAFAFAMMIAAAILAALLVVAAVPSEDAFGATSDTPTTLTMEAAADDSPGLVAIALSAGPHYVPGAPMVVASAPRYAGEGYQAAQAAMDHLDAIDVTAPMATAEPVTAQVSNLSAHAVQSPAPEREIQAVAVLLVVAAGCAALVGAFVLRRRMHGEEER